MTNPCNIYREIHVTTLTNTKTWTKFNKASDWRNDSVTMQAVLSQVVEIQKSHGQTDQPTNLLTGVCARVTCDTTKTTKSMSTTWKATLLGLAWWQWSTRSPPSPPPSIAQDIRLRSRLRLRDGVKKSKWKFKMAFAMKGGAESEKAKTFRIARFLSQKLSGLNP